MKALHTQRDYSDAIRAITRRARLTEVRPMEVEIKVPFYAMHAVGEALESGRLIGVMHTVSKLSTLDHLLLWSIRWKVFEVRF